MKLRLRSLQTKETTKIEVPNSCTVQELKETLSLSLPCSASPLFTFSLNGKDELRVPSPQDSLQSLGITSGDLIYFSSNPHDGSSPSSSGNPQQPIIDPIVNCPEPEKLELDMFDLGEKKETPVGVVESSSLNSRDLDPDCDVMTGEETENVDSDMIDASVGAEGSGGVDDMDADGKRFLEPYFLRRVLREELGGDGSAKKLLVVAVHAVFMESGFVGFDSVSGMRIDGFRVADEWPSNAFTMLLFYTLPGLLGNGVVAESVKLRFQGLGDFVNVYGSLGKGRSRTYRVCLNERRFGSTLKSVWANCGKDGGIDGNDTASRASTEKEAFEFWKIVKDGLAYPLLINLCDKSGLGLPPCLMRLPMDLKLKILESLPGIDVARMACVCSETRYLSSSNDLWKQKYVEEFGTVNVGQDIVNWKHKFSSSWESKKKRRRQNRPSSRHGHRVPRHFPPTFFPLRPSPFPIIWGDPDPLGPPPFVGGDYDRMPGLGVPSPLRQPGQTFPRIRRLQYFSPNCRLGGSNE